MNNKIIIDLKGAATAKRYSDDEIFQKNKFEEIKHIFDVITDEIKGKNCENIVECRNHDTIFVDGERGSGKTAFLLNIKNYIGNKDKGLSRKLKFFKPVDPTLLEDSENFISIIIARILEEVNEYYKNCLNTNIQKDTQERYFKSLNYLSDSIASIKDIKEDKGIDEIASYASSMKLEENAHQFFRIVAEIFEVEKLIVLIDDVDMAFDKGFEVLEVVRKYLASPYVIPIVAGDYGLYEDIVKNHFKKQFVSCNDRDISCNDRDAKKLEDKINNLTEQYFLKVFPIEFRIKLKDIGNIIKNSDVKVKVENDEIDFNELIEFDRNSLNIGINRKEEQFCVIRYNTRELTKYLYRKKDIFKEFKKELQEKKIPDINLLKKSYEKTAEFYEYSTDDEKVFFSKLLYNDIDSFKNEKYDVYEAFKGIENFKENGDFKFKNPIFNSLRISNKEKYKEIEKNTDNELIYLYELFKLKEKVYYEHQTGYYIVPGKFLRHMFLSFRRMKLNKIIEKIKEEKIEKKEFNEIQWNNLLEEVKNYINDEKRVEDLKELIKQSEIKDIFENVQKDFIDILYENINNIDNQVLKDDKNKNQSDNSSDIEEEEVPQKNIIVEEFILKIILWHYDFVDNKDFVNSVAIYKSLDKFFDNFNRLENIKDGLLIDTLQRIVLMFINSIALFENKNNRISYYDIGIKKKDFILANTLQKDNSILLNIKPLILTDKPTLTKALFFHPLIANILLAEDEKLANFVKDEAILKKQREQQEKKQREQQKKELEQKIKIPEDLKSKSKLYMDDKITILLNLKKHIDELTLEEIQSLNEYTPVNKALNHRFSANKNNLKDNEKQLKVLIDEINQKIKEAKAKLAQNND